MADALRNVLLYSTLGYEARGAKRALVRTLNDAADADVDSRTSTFTLTRADGHRMKGGLLRRLPGKTFGMQLWEADFSDVSARGSTRSRRRWPCRPEPQGSIHARPFLQWGAVPERTGRSGLKAWAASVRFEDVQAWKDTVQFKTQPAGSTRIPLFLNNDHGVVDMVPCQYAPRIYPDGACRKPAQLKPGPDGTTEEFNACNPLFGQLHGFHDANSNVAEATSHGAFLSGLMQVWKRRARRSATPIANRCATRSWPTCYTWRSSCARAAQRASSPTRKWGASRSRRTAHTARSTAYTGSVISPRTGNGSTGHWPPAHATRR